jgi:hypothetical protein
MTRAKRAGGVAQAVEHLPSKCKAKDKTSTKKRKKKQNKNPKYL